MAARTSVPNAARLRAGESSDVNGLCVKAAEVAKKCSSNELPTV